MKSNDALIAHLINKDEKQNDKLAATFLDERLVNPEQIKVSANEVVYLHFFKSNIEDFETIIETATETLVLNRKNTVEGMSNTIVRAVSDITLKNAKEVDFFVQLLRIQY